MRHIAILSTHSGINLEDNIINKFSNSSDVAFHIYSSTEYSISSEKNVVMHIFPNECNTVPKMINYILAEEKSRKPDNRYLHILLDSVKIKKDPLIFINLLDNVLEKLHMTSWLSTVCDPMNYVYKKYNPRVQIDLDDECKNMLKVDKLLFTSHSNTYWMCFDLNADDECIKFNESFEIPMYYTIEFLARRKANAQPLDFMNMYLTIEEEQNLFDVEQISEKYSDEQFKSENDIFKDLKLDITPTNMIDTVLENLYNVLNNKG